MFDVSSSVMATDEKQLEMIPRMLQQPNSFFDEGLRPLATHLEDLIRVARLSVPLSALGLSIDALGF